MLEQPAMATNDTTADKTPDATREQHTGPATDTPDWEEIARYETAERLRQRTSVDLSEQIETILHSMQCGAGIDTGELDSLRSSLVAIDEELTHSLADLGDLARPSAATTLHNARYRVSFTLQAVAAAARDGTVDADTIGDARDAIATAERALDELERETEADQ